MSTLKLNPILTLLLSGSISVTAHAQEMAGTQPETPPAISLTPASDKRPPAQASALQAPHAQGLLFGASLGGGRIQDKVMGVGGTALEAHLGYFPSRWLGVVGSGSMFWHSIDDSRRMSLYGAALMAELHPLERVWLSAGPGYYALALSTDNKADMTSVDSKSLKSFGGELDLGLDIYRAGVSGLSSGIVLRSQVAAFDSQPVFTTLALINVRWYGAGKTSAASQSLAPNAQGSSPDPLSVSSSCGDPVTQLFSVLQLGGHP
jgi:hypothetical protein